MKDITFIIPIKIDTPDRIHNCGVILRFLNLHFKESEVLVIEMDNTSKTEKLKNIASNAEFHFIERKGRFVKSEVTNYGIKIATRNIICMYDADILLNPKAIKKAVKIINKGYKRIILPFNNIFVDVEGELRKEISETLTIEDHSNYTKLSEVPIGKDISVRTVNGGIMVGHKKTLMAEGGYNQKMISYGWEDSEFFKRFEKLGYPYFALPKYNLIHLVHQRGPDSQQNEMYFKNKDEFLKVEKMNKANLQNYVDTDLNFFNISQEEKAKIRSRQLFINLFTFQKFRYLLNKSFVYISILGFSNSFKKYILRKPVSHT